MGPGVVSSDRHGNELITIGTQTTEVVMTADCEHVAVVENVRGCSKAATPQQLSDFYHGAWPIVVGKVIIHVLLKPFMIKKVCNVFKLVLTSALKGKTTI